MYGKTIRSATLAALMGLTGLAMAQDESKGDSEVLARVNGETVTRAEVNAMIAQRSDSGKSLSDFNADQQEKLVNRLVEVALLADEANNRGLTDRPGIAAEIEVTRDLTLARALLRELGQGQSDISEDELRAKYEEKYGDGGGNAELKASHIVVEEESKANEIIGKLDEGADFAELAKEHSTGPSGDKGGDLGWFKPGEMVPAFTEAVQDLDKGSYTEEPVETDYGYHVIKLEDERQGSKPSFEDKRQELQRQLANDRITKVIDDLRSNADVEMMMDSGKGSSQKKGSSDKGKSSEGGSE